MNTTLTIQGWFYLLTGFWPVIHYRSFEAVTGPKVDQWLVKCMGLMIACSGTIFVLYSDTRPALVLAILNATVLSAVDAYYVARKIISKIFLVDAAIELTFVVLYAVFGKA